MNRFSGRGVAAGFAVGRAVIAVREARQVRYRLAASGVDRERQRLRTARDRTRAELEEIASRVARTVGPAQAAIFSAQLLMLDDPLLAVRTDELVRQERINADWAVERAIADLHDAFGRDGDEWLQGRDGDLSDVGGRLRGNLRPGRDPLVSLVQEIEPPVIVIADDLPPSVAAQLDWSKISGLVCAVGGPTNHTVILARSLGVPTVVGLAGATQLITPGQTVAIDGTTGEVVVSPSEELLQQWSLRAASATASARALDQLRTWPARTADNVRIRLEANLEIAEEVGRVHDAGAEGIGLYRSEFLLDSVNPESASEEAQVRIYRGLLEAMAPLPVTVRTFDAGAERGMGRPGAGQHRDRFGLRGIRAGLQHDERFRTQIRALLRSADAGTLRILLPFVTVGAELRQARAVISELARELGIVRPVPVGAMIEVPAAALAADHLCEHADFLSVGTNDLIQYTLAVDRTDERPAGHDEPLTPAVLRLLRIVVALGRRGCTDLSVCGEMAGDPLLVAMLVGLGFRAFSMTPAAIPQVKRALSALDTRHAATMARRAVRARTADEVRALLEPLAESVHHGVVG